MSQTHRDVPPEVPKKGADVQEDVKNTANICRSIWSEQAALKTTDQRATTDQKTDKQIVNPLSTTDITKQLQSIATRLNNLPPEIQSDFLKNSAYVPRDHGGKIDSDKHLAVNTNLDSLKKILTTV
jgi:hypothetical protein